MLSDYMSREQIHNEIFNDYRELGGDMDELKARYIKERKDNRVNKYLIYPKSYELVTKNKNNWIVSLSKSASLKAFNDIYDIKSNVAVYYEREFDLRFFVVSPDEWLTVFDSEVLDQYFELMHFVDEMNRVEILKRFLEKNGCGATVRVSSTSEGRITFYKEGVMYGNFESNGKWLVQDSFYTRDCATPEQLQLEIDLLRNVREKAEADLGKEAVRYLHAMDVVTMIKEKIASNFSKE